MLYWHVCPLGSPLVPHTINRSSTLHRRHQQCTQLLTGGFIVAARRERTWASAEAAAQAPKKGKVSRYQDNRCDVRLLEPSETCSEPALKGFELDHTSEEASKNKVEETVHGSTCAESTCATKSFRAGAHLPLHTTFHLIAMHANRRDSLSTPMATADAGAYFCWCTSKQHKERDLCV